MYTAQHFQGIAEMVGVQYRAIVFSMPNLTDADKRAVFNNLVGTAILHYKANYRGGYYFKEDKFRSVCAKFAQYDPANP